MSGAERRLDLPRCATSFSRAVVQALVLGSWGIFMGGAAAPGFAHAYHASLAEVELNAETGRLEVALRVLPEDLEDVLAREMGERIPLDATEKVDRWIVKYLESVFRVLRPEDPAQEPRPLVWVGKEVSHRAAWLYFEIPIDPRERWTLENRVFFDLESDQVNTVLFRHRGEQKSWTFTADTARVQLPPLSPPP